jgi:apolipoprotein N-acyltransferase
VRDVTHLIWPESAFPFFLTREPDALDQIAGLLPEGTVLITGAVRAPETVPNAAITRAYNSIYVIDHDGSILSTYDKVHLVPFGEYLPFQDQLERIGLLALTKVRGGFIAGARRRALTVPRAPNVVPLICYEVIFPGEAAPAGERAGWMLNLTNDGWFGEGAAQWQQAATGLFRAVENHLPLVRCANNGLTCWIDARGVLRDYFVDPDGTIYGKGFLTVELPLPAGGGLHTPTFYTRHGDWFGWSCVGISVALLVVRLVRGGFRKERSGGEME